jgi:hypothetical protein
MPVMHPNDPDCVARRKKMRFHWFADAWDRVRRFINRNAEVLIFLLRVVLIILRAIGILTTRMCTARRRTLAGLPRAIALVERRRP